MTDLVELTRLGTAMMLIRRAVLEGMAKDSGAIHLFIDAAKAADELLWLGLSPEGTRRHTDGWRSGFYQVALGADVPLALIRLDYGRREVRITDFIHLSGDMDADYARMAEAYAGVRGQRPSQASPIAPLPKRPTPDTV